MKKIISLFVVVLAFMCCVSLTADAKNRTKRRTKTKTSYTLPDGVVHRINAAQYKKLVADYTSSPYVLKGRRPAVVDFNATWCGPCRRQAPILDKLARIYSGQVDFYSVDTDENTEVSRSYGIRSIPAIFVFSSSGRWKSITGLTYESELRSLINSVIY